MWNPIKWAFRKGKNAVEKIKPKDLGIEAIIPTNYPATFQYNYEMEGNDTDFFRSGGQGYLLVWRKGLKTDERNKLIEKLGKIL
jgi:hypothetical protein